MCRHYSNPAQPLHDAVEAAWVQCVRTMAACISAVSAHLLADSSPLTHAVTAVFADARDATQWQLCHDTLGCFKTRLRGHWFSVNLCTGVVLKDGQPPGKLPNAVREHALYWRVFGGRNFEVSTDLKTTQPVNGKHYQWLLVGARLEVTETDVETGEQLQLLPGMFSCVLLTIYIKQNRTGALTEQLPESADDCAWCPLLPVRLREMHSHWHSTAHESTLR